MPTAHWTNCGLVTQDMSSAHNPFTTVYSQPGQEPDSGSAASTPSCTTPSSAGLATKRSMSFGTTPTQTPLSLKGQVPWIPMQPIPNEIQIYCGHYIITGNHILPRHRHYTLSYLMRCRCPLMSLRRSCVTTSMMSWPWRLRPLKLHAQQLTRRNPNHLTAARATRRWYFYGWGGSIRVTNWTSA